MDIRTIATGAYASDDASLPHAVAAHDEQTYRAAWERLIGAEEPRPVDFAREAVIFLMGGQRSTGGWSVVPRGATLDGDTLVIDAAIQGPPAGSMATQAITTPYAVIAVPDRTFTTVQWDPRAATR